MTRVTIPKRIKQLSLICKFSETGSDSTFIYDCFHEQDLSSMGGKHATCLESLFNLENYESAYKIKLQA